MNLKEKIQESSEKFLNEIILLRRHLHAHPELSFEEHNTSRFIAGKLKEWNIPFKDGIVKTGIVATITGVQLPSPSDNRTGKVKVAPVGQDRVGCIALRADMDALPIEEKNDVAYISKNPGIMHACGHDVHTASLLGVARILNELKNEFSGTVKLIFQPGEEKAPGGASLMIKEGVLDNPRPAGILAQHVFPSLEAGKVGFRTGKYMASTDEIYLNVKGKGGHAAMKGTYVNPLLIASEILLTLESVFGGNKGIGDIRNIKETTSISPIAPISSIPTVLAFGRIHANGATNVIPENVTIDGTLRTLDEAWRKEAHVIIRELAASKARQMGGGCEVNIMTGYPAVINDEKITLSAIKFAQEYLGKENVVELDLRMTGEDFSFYQQQVPGCFYRLGTGNVSKGITSGVHTPTFDIDESSLKTGMGLMAWLAISRLAIDKKQ